MAVDNSSVVSNVSRGTVSNTVELLQISIISSVDCYVVLTLS